jgi:hypothetical protein
MMPARASGRGTAPKPLRFNPAGSSTAAYCDSLAVNGIARPSSLRRPYHVLYGQTASAADRRFVKRRLVALGSLGVPLDGGDQCVYPA